jgi:hypothetical protein
VDAPLGAVQSTGQELGERQAGSGRHAPDHGEARMEVHRLHDRLVSFDDQTIHQHKSRTWFL